MSQDYNSLYQETAADPFAHRGFYETPPSSTSPQFPSVFSTMPNLQPYSTVPLAQDPEMVDLSKRALSDAGSTLPFWDNPASMEGPSARLSAGGSAFDSGEDWEIETDRPWYRKRWVAIVAVAGLLALAAIALGVGLGVGLGEKKQNNAEGGQQNQGGGAGPTQPTTGAAPGLTTSESTVAFVGISDILLVFGFRLYLLIFNDSYLSFINYLLLSYNFLLDFKHYDRQLCVIFVEQSLADQLIAKLHHLFFYYEVINNKNYQLVPNLDTDVAVLDDEVRVDDDWHRLSNFDTIVARWLEFQQLRTLERDWIGGKMSLATLATASSTLHLQRQLNQLRKHPVDGFSAGLVDDDNIYEWEITIFGPADTLYDGGFFRARLTFPEDFPLNPPKMKFITEMWHPNIYKNGDVCISILHAPGVDQYGYEDAGERWMPVHGVESILISVISLLSADTPNTDSPANIDAAKEVREDIAAYRKKVRRLARKSAEEGW